MIMTEWCTSSMKGEMLYDVSTWCSYWCHINDQFRSYTLLPAPHTHTQQNVCHSASPFALNWVINHPTPPPLAFRQWVLFPEPRGLCSLFCPAIYFRGDQVMHIHFACTRMPVFFFIHMWEMRMPPPHSHPSWFLCQNQFASRWQWNTAGKPPRRGMS